MGGTLDGKVVVVTGAAGGIGGAACRALAAAGASVVAADTDVAAGEQVAAEVGGLFVGCDVSTWESNLALMATAAEHAGRIDHAFLNAGIATFTSAAADFDPDLYRRAMAVNLDGVIYGAQAALPHLTVSGGSIVATASLAGLTGMPVDPYYTANKHGVVGFVRAAGPLWAGTQGVRVNAVCPGFTESAIVDPVRESVAAAGIPLLAPEAVADVVLTLIDGTMSGECWFVQPGRQAAPFEFRGVPGPRSAAAGHAAP